MPMWTGRARAFGQARLVVAVRVGFLILLAAVTISDEGAGRDQALAVIALGVVALGASIPLPSRILSRWQPLVETVAACIVIMTIDPLPDSMLRYLIAPALAAGLASGFVIATTTVGLGALTLLLGRVLEFQTANWSDYSGDVSQWTLIALAVGLLASWVHGLQAEQSPPDNAAYAAAYRLISQLRMVSRQLSGGLDPVTLSEGLLDHLHHTVPFDRAAVYVRTSGGRLSPLTARGADRISWDAANPLFDEAWASSVPARQSRPLSKGGPGFAAAIPLQIGLRTFGLVALERTNGAFEGAEMSRATTALEEQALRLETALLFSEVRTLATAEERRRLAREIHDGIAQELASLGYVVDDLAARAKYLPDLEQDIKALRGELTRVISELRLSIFDLRSDVQSSAGLGTALSDYVRQVGVGSNFTVHLVLDETPARLPVDAEAELLRIAQEAITNARKHANATNLWVTCSVDPPRAILRVEDDGTGLGRPRDDSFGLEVMRERAERVGAHLTVSNREEGGTRVEVSLGANRTPEIR